ncbi:hypothetical protein GCM10011494_21170 [Novosphingobium endophyticum]|uniref:Uncharacterized protein n=1 Tax=Novosphingobium endophyticum TaxID=1955250 RepID=A0A916TSV1_9SPHN|nr:hypothetical protein [Novosphingobium endophyticum]GGC02352.1 hypothetical protein GCM10011494_21170 [Novosphingobium endophyticum]
MNGDGVLLLGGLAAIGGVALLRFSWSRRKRSHRLNLAGWSLLALAVVAGAQAAGAWGVAIEALVAMALAFVLLAWAGWTSPPGVMKASNRRAGMLPEGGAPLRLRRRLTTFALVGLMAVFAAIGLALGLRMLALLGGAGEADANALALFTTPLAWSGLVFAMLMTGDRRRQLAMLAIGCLVAVPAFLTGVQA